MVGFGRHYAPGWHVPGTEAACAQFPAVGEDFQATYADSLAPLLGIVSETDLSANYNVDGSVLPVGEPVTRKYGSDEYEFYVQDSWKVGSSLTVTGGLRYGLYSPPWEVNGQQVAPNIDLGTLLATRQSNMLAGIPDNTLPLDRLRSWRVRPTASRASTRGTRTTSRRAWRSAWSPHGEGGLWGKLTGGDKLVVRGGYSMVYDRIGQALATRFDQVGSFGLSTQLSSPVNANNEDNPDIRFTGHQRHSRRRCRQCRPAGSRRRRRSASRNPAGSSPRRSTARSRRRTRTSTTSSWGASSAATTRSRRPTSGAPGATS